MLDRGVPVHTVAERIGDDPAVLLRSYAKRKRQRGDRPTMDEPVAAVILGTQLMRGAHIVGPNLSPGSRCVQ